MTEALPERSLPCFSVAPKFYLQNFNADLGFGMLILLKRHKIQPFSPRRMSDVSCA